MFYDSKRNREKCETLVWGYSFTCKILVKKIQELEEQKDDPENKASALENSSDLLKRKSENCPPRLWNRAGKYRQNSGRAGFPQSGSGCQMKRALFSIYKVTAAMCSWLGPGPSGQGHLGFHFLLLLEQGVCWLYRRGHSPSLSLNNKGKSEMCLYQEPAGTWPRWRDKDKSNAAWVATVGYHHPPLHPIRIVIAGGKRSYGCCNSGKSCNLQKCIHLWLNALVSKSI